MSDETPTMKDVADNTARIETIEDIMGLLDGEPEPGNIDWRPYEDWGPDEAPEPPTKENVLEAVRDGVRESERRKRRNTSTAVMNDGRVKTAELDLEYEDPKPSFVGESSDRLTQAQIHEVLAHPARIEFVDCVAKGSSIDESLPYNPLRLLKEYDVAHFVTHGDGQSRVSKGPNFDVVRSARNGAALSSGAEEEVMDR